MSAEKRIGGCSGRYPDLREDAVSFHMPGHKGRLIFSDVPNDFLKYDLTELPGMDDLIQPEAWIKGLTKRLSSFYGSESSRILVGGSSSGILGAILGASKFHEARRQYVNSENSKNKVRALINRNAHISVYNAVEIAGMDAKYISPELRSGIPSHFDIDLFKEYLKDDVDILVLTYPFYQGGLYDIGRMMEIARQIRQDITIIVDEAHGAHLVLAEYYHQKKLSSLSLGADIVIQSFHKTLPALGQAAVLHYGSTSRGRELLNRSMQMHSVEWYLKALQTTSPSYLVLKSISDMMEVLESEGAELYRRLMENIENFYAGSGLKPFDYAGSAVQDESKLLLPFSEQEKFIEKGIYPEMELDGYILFLASIANEKRDFERLGSAVAELSRFSEHSSSHSSCGLQSDSVQWDYPMNQDSSKSIYFSGNVAMNVASEEDASEEDASIKNESIKSESIKDALMKDASMRNVSIKNTSTEKIEERLLRYGMRASAVASGSKNGDRRGSGEYEEISAIDAVGRRSAETLVLYPPGSPLISEGEIFEEAVAEKLGEIKVKVYLS